MSDQETVKEYAFEYITEVGQNEYIVEYESGDIHDIEGDQKILVSLNSMGRYTAEDVLTKMKTVDGTGSGLDADLLDGFHAQEAVAMAVIPVRDSDGELPGNIKGTAPTLKTAREINLSGDVSGSVEFDGSANVGIEVTLADTGVTAGTHTKVTVDSKGRVTTGATLAATDIPALDWSKITTGKPTTLDGFAIADAVGILTQLKTVDGSASGLDADTLDGVHASQFDRNDVAATRGQKLTINRNGTDDLVLSGNDGQYVGMAFCKELLNRFILYIDNTVESGSNAGSNLQIQARGDDGTYLGQVLQVDRASQVVNFNASPTTNGGKKIWHEDNDGSGSGLDADKLDGLEGNKFVFGDNPAACRVAPATEDLTDETMWKGGFWQVNGAAPSDWSPTTDAWYWGITIPHTANGDAYNYSAQIAVNATTGDMYFRKVSGGATPVAGDWNLVATTDDIAAHADDVSIHRETTISSSDPSGGSDGDIWLKYET